VAGWAIAQFPYLLPETLKVEQAAGAESTLLMVIVVFIAALVIVVPALVLLLWLSQRQVLE
jgi:cytochrome bd ubiquinol oxidase subunit II